MSQKLAKISDLADYQPLADSLTALGTLTPATDTLPYFSGTSSALTTSLTVFARTLLDDTSQTDAKTTLGLNNVDNTSDVNKPVSTAQAAALDLKLNLAGGTLSGFLTLNADPSSAFHAATKQYVDNASAGLDAKPSVVAATTANITLSGTQTIDGIGVVATDRVLVKNQSAPENNGIYVVSAGAWTRATDVDSWAELISAFVFVETGTVNADTGWVCNVDAGGTLGVTAVTFVQFTSSASITAGTGIAYSGGVVSLAEIANNTVLGNISGSTAAPIALTASQLKTLLSLVVADVSGAAPLASPTFTGTPSAPTATTGTSTTQLATTAFTTATAQAVNEYAALSNSTGNTTVTPAATTREYIGVVAVTGSAGTRIFAISTSGRVVGDIVRLRYNFPATASIVVELRSGTTGGTLIDTITTDASGDDACHEAVYTGSAFVLTNTIYPA